MSEKVVGGLNAGVSGERVVLHSTILGGSYNTVLGDYSMVLGGSHNTVTGDYALVASCEGVTTDRDHALWFDNVDFTNCEGDEEVLAALHAYLVREGVIRE